MVTAAADNSLAIARTECVSSNNAMWAHTLAFLGPPKPQTQMAHNSFGQAIFSFFVMYAPVTCHTWFEPFDGYTRVSCLCRVTPLTCPWGLTYCNQTCRASCVAVRADVVTGPPLMYAREIERFLFAVCLLYLGAIYSMHDFWLTRFLRHFSSSVPSPFCNTVC